MAMVNETHIQSKDVPTCHRGNAGILNKIRNTYYLLVCLGGDD